MAEERIICVGCPLGCEASLRIDDKGEIIKITGCKCKQGRQYVLEEYQNPVRILTATILTESDYQPLLSVRTNKPVLKTKLVDMMKTLARVRAKPPVEVGQVVLLNVMDTGADVVATSVLPS